MNNFRTATASALAPIDGTARVERHGGGSIAQK